MFPMFGWGWGWDWGWGWAAAAGSFFLFVIWVAVWFFFLWNLQGLLQRVDPRNRAIPPGHVWLNFIPIFNLGWFLYTVIKIKESLAAEYALRRWNPEGDQGYNVGIAAGVLAIASFFLGWIPVVGWAIGLAAVICWVLYWLKTHEIKNQLGAPVAWSQVPPTGYPGAESGPYAQPAQHPYDQQTGTWADTSGATGAGAAAGAAGAAWMATQEPAQTGYEPPAEPSAWTAAAAVEAEEAAAAAPPMQAVPAPEEQQDRPARVWAAPPVAPTAPSGEAASATPAAGVSAEGAQPQELRCAACGSGYETGDKFCRSCGLRLP